MMTEKKTSKKTKKIKLMDLQEDGSFGKFFGHPNAIENDSKEMIGRLLKEFKLKFSDIKKLLEKVEKTNDIKTLQSLIKTEFSKRNWISEKIYPESNYKADFGKGKENEDRWILVEVELSDPSRCKELFYMERVFRTGFMNLGVLISPKREHCNFYNSVVARYSYNRPNFPLWIIGIDIT